jgi:hypothetical protein
MPEPEFPCCWHCEHVDGYVHMMDCLVCGEEPEPGGATSAWEHHR